MIAGSSMMGLTLAPSDHLDPWRDDMNKLMLLGGAALFVLSGAAIAQSAAGESAPDAPSAAPAPPSSAPPPADTPAPAPDSAAPTAAQSPTPAADAAATTPSAPAVAQSTAPAADAAATTPSDPGTATASADATAKVNADWAKYDAGNKGKLTPLEFGTWTMAAKGQDMTAQVEKTKTSKKANLPAVQVLNATAADFARADTDKDKMISPTELAAFLSA